MACAMNNGESGRFKGLALRVAVCFFLAAPTPVSAATLSEDVEVSVFKNFGLNVITAPRIGTVMAPFPADSPVIYILRSDGLCRTTVEGVGAFGCLDGISGQNRTQGSVSATGEPGRTVNFTSNLTNNDSNDLNGTDCTGGTGATPAKLKLVFFNPTSAVLNFTTGIAAPVEVGAWLIVWDTTLGFQTCAYVINVDLP